MRRMLFGRRHEISRLEAFSDAAFAFALTLLVVSLEVPRSYTELTQLMKGFGSFACCFALLVWIWYEHNVFFRRYGLQDPLTVLFNGMLMFMVLFYVYPLKFMFDSLFAVFIPAAYPDLQRMTLQQLSRASAIYGLGFVALLLMFVLLYAYAYRKREELELTAVDVFEAKASAGAHLISAGVGAIVFLVSMLAPVRYAPMAPTLFALMGPAHWFYGHQVDRRRARLAHPPPTDRTASQART